jgi:hypothetical protein
LVEQAAKFGSWTLENTKAIHSAVRDLCARDGSKKWINVGCIPHRTAPTMQDFCAQRRRGSVTKAYSGSKMHTDAHKVANYINYFATS